MVKMIEIREVLKNLLKSVHPNVMVNGDSVPRVHYQDAPDKAVYPYLVYNLPNSTDDGTLENFVLDVDGWDNTTITTALETLMDAADKELHRKTVVVGNLSLTLYRENRLPLEDDDKRLRRRKYIYQVRTYEGA
jgi:hypothetical protein